MKKDARYLLAKKQSGRKISMLTCYDYPTALLEDRAGIDIILVGDSVGTNILGYQSEAEVTLEDIIHHLKAVRRGVSQAYILADLPYGTYDTPERALDSAQKLLFYGADGVKLEGLKQEVITHLVDRGIEICGHLGLLPQTHTKKAVRGKSFDEAKEIIEGALILEKIGVFMLLFELIPEEVAKIITEKVKIPTIGIGAGRFTDGQVLIINDILGITPRQLKLAKRYQDYQNLTFEAIARYQKDVEQLSFPARENVRSMPEEQLEQLNQWLQQNF